MIKRFFWILLIIVLLFLMIIPTIVYGATDSEKNTPRVDNKQLSELSTISEKIVAKVHLYGIIKLICESICYILCPVLLIIGIILCLKKKEKNNLKVGIILIISSILVFIIGLILEKVLQANMLRF